MYLNGSDQYLRKFIHIEAVLKHVTFARTGPVAVPAISTALTQQFIEDVSRSQADKWREYAQSGNGGPDGSPWSNAS
jgi:hypothetical protein